MSGYICAVTAAAMAVSILVALAGRGSVGAVVKLLAGVFMALTVISPLVKLELPDPETWMYGFESDSSSAVMAGEELADEARRLIIKQRTEAYILDKAAGYNADIRVNVVLDGAGIPAAVELSGAAAPYAKAALTRELAAQLGLGEEDVQWTS